MRLAVYRHLQRLSPRFYARTPLGEVLARVNNDVGEIQRVAAESLLAWVGNAIFLVGSLARDVLSRCAARAASAVALVPVSVWALQRARARLADRVRAVREASAGVGSFLIETLQAMRLIVTSNAQEREVERFSRKNAAFIDALMSMQALVVPRRQRTGTDSVARLRRRVRVRRPSRDRGHTVGRRVRRVPRLSDAAAPAGAGADGPLCEPRDRAGVARARAGTARREA